MKSSIYKSDFQTGNTPSNKPKKTKQKRFYRSCERQKAKVARKTSYEWAKDKPCNLFYAACPNQETFKTTYDSSYKKPDKKTKVY